MRAGTFDPFRALQTPPEVLQLARNSRMTTNEVQHFILEPQIFDLATHLDDVRVGRFLAAGMLNLWDIYQQQEKDAWLTGEDPAGLSEWGRWAQGRLEKAASSRRFCKEAIQWQPTGRPPEWERGPRHCWMLKWGPVIRTNEEIFQAAQPQGAEGAALSPQETPNPPGLKQKTTFLKIPP